MGSEAQPRSFGPYRPLDKNAGELSEKQKAAIASLVARYEAKMPGSKRVTQEGRRFLADPRAVAGFKSTWKEMVFPVVTERSEGARLWDIDGNEFIDITLGFGTNFLGHRPPFVVEALERQLALGMEIGPQSPLAARVAEKLCRLTGMERAAFCNTGSEAVMAAIRVARTVTGRDKIALFSGAYHGQFDEVLVRAAGEISLPVAPGIPDSAVENVLVLEYGSDESLETLRREAGSLAAVLVEPVQSRHPDLQPVEFARELRKITQESGTALVFDEVVTGFRTHVGGVQALWDIRADIATYGKVVGGGFPIGIVAGSSRFLDALDGGFWSFGDASAPEAGMTFFAGTFVRHPLALAAADAVLDYLVANPNLQSELNARTAAFADELNREFLALGAPIRIAHFSSMYYVQMPPEAKLAGLLYYALRLRGVHLWEARPGFLSIAHTDEDIARVKAAFLESARELLDGDLLPSHAPTKPRLTEAQEEVWLAARLSDAASCTLNESLSLEIVGPLDVPRLEAALRGLIARHEALRTTFSSEDGTPALLPAGAWALQRVSGDARELAEIEGRLPFDLENGPLVRTTLVSESPERHTLILSAHHLVCDGWSFGVVLRELKALYEGESLPPAPSFAAYAAESEPDAETLSWWTTTLDAPPPAPELPTDRPYPPVRTYEGGRESLPLPLETLDGLRALSKTCGATLFTTLFAGLSGLLYRLTGQREMLIGVPAAGQATEGARNLVGHCVHLLPLRVSLAPERPFQEQLDAVKSVVLDAFEHPNTTLGTLIRALKLPRESGRIPLTGVTFNLDREDYPDSLGAARLHIKKSPRSFFQFDLGFNLVETDSGLTLEANYNADILDGATVRRWLGYYATLLAALVADPKMPIERLPLLESTDEATILGWSRGQTPAYPRDESVGAIFAAHAALTPDAIALRSEGETLTYSQLDERTRALAARLVARGVGKGDRVGVVLERTPDLLVALLAVLRAGAAYVPLDPGHPAERREALLKDAGALLTLDETTLDALRSGSDEELRTPLPAVSGDDAAYVIYTSGSTGLPKGVVVPHRAILRLVQETDYVRLTPTDVLGQAATVAFDAATFEIWGALLNGACVALLPREVALHPTRLRENLARFGVTTLFLTTALFNEIAHQAPDAFSDLTYLLFGGEVSDAECARRVLRSGPPKNLIHVYGPTEATTFATFWPVREIPEDATTLPIGRPISHTDALVLDEAGRLCAPGVPGELHLGGDGLALGYWRDDMRSAEKFVEVAPFGRLYKTGDRVCWSTDGQLEFLGRTDGQLKLRGFRIEPGEIEATLRSHPAIQEARVVLRDGALAAYFVPALGLDGAPDSAELRAYLSERLPTYMVPVACVPLVRLPLNANGKLDVAALPAPEASCLVQESASEEPRTETERTLARLWSELLGRTSIGIHDDFFALGGHSLLVVRLLSRIEAELGKPLPLASLFAAPTIARQALLLAEGAPVPSASEARSLVALHPQGDRPRLYCVHHGYGDLTGYHELVRSLGTDQPVYGFQARGIDGEAEPLERIEEMAAHYISELRAFQPDGPYHLTGFSLGGVIAFEMARQLRDSGAEVGLLALLDTYAPIFFQRGERGGLLSELASVAGDMFRVAPQDRWRFAVSRGRAASHRLRGMLHRAEPSGLSDEEGRLRAAIRRVEAASRRALERYTPSLYAGRAVVFRAKDGEVAPGYDPVLWWTGVIQGGVEVCELPGDHHAILREPGVGLLATRLRQCLDEAGG